MSMELVRQLPYGHPYRWDGTLFGGPKLWRPSNLGSALALWLDAEDAGTITLNGSTVSQWSDKSGGSNHATQPTAASQPTYSTTGLSGKPCVLFDNDFFTIPSTGTLGINTLAGYDALFVARVTSSNPCFLYSSGLESYEAHTAGSAFLRTIYNASPYADAIIGGTTGAALYQSHCSPSSGQIDAASRINGVLGTPVLRPLNAADASIKIGSRHDYSFMFAGDIAEIVFTRSAVATADRQRLEGYLAWKWALEGSLPSGHPYKNTPPTV
jgi:hypothetical protein